VEIKPGHCFYHAEHPHETPTFFATINQQILYLYANINNMAFIGEFDAESIVSANHLEASCPSL
jgi:hypothetical protein